MIISPGKIVLALLLLSMTGCATIGPNYSTPGIELAGGWANQSQADTQSTADELAIWWKTIDDPQLLALIENALQNNLDLKSAKSAVKQARLERIVTKSSLYPTANASGSEKKSGTKEDGSSSIESDAYSAGFDASWEIDLFGGTRRSVEASKADYEASVEELRDVQISMLAEVASSYIDVRTYQQRLRVAKENIALQGEIQDLLEALSEAGSGDELAIAQSRYNLENSRSSVPDSETGLEEAMNSLAILTGKPAGSLHEQLKEEKALPHVSTQLAVGIPADLLKRRPDIRKAERELAAQTARVGEAEAALYPKLSLAGSIGIEAISADKLISSPTQLWSLGPTLSWPLFRAGSLRNQVKIENEQMEQAYISYQAAVLAATKEVENALVAYVNEQQKLEHLREGAKSARLAKELAEQKYTTGMTDFNDVLDAQRALIDFEDSVSQSKGAVISDLIHLYKVLGGGWSPMGDAEAEGKTPSARAEK